MIKLEDVQRGYDAWAAKPHNAKWVRKIDGTPIANDIVVSIFDALKAIAPQAPVSAVPRWSVTVHESDERTWLGLKSSQGQEAMLSCKTKHDNGETLGSQIVKAFAASFASPPPPAQADDGKDAEIGYLKIEMEGVENAKEEIGRLLGLTEEFRWKRISAAIHEQKRLIRELMVVLAQVEDRARMPRGVTTRSKWVTIPAVVYSRVYEALTKAKAAGFEEIKK